MKTKALLFLSFCIFLAFSKHIMKEIKLTNEKNFQYLTKFAISVGVGSFNASIYYKYPIYNSDQKVRPINLGLYMDYEWQQALDQENCHDKISFARKLNLIQLDSTNQKEIHVSYTISQVGSPHVWYFALIECPNSEADPIVEEMPVVVDMTIQGFGGTHFSHDEIGFLPFSILFAIILFFCLISSIYKCVIDCTKMDRIYYPTCLLIFSIVLQFSSLFLDSLHLSSYSLNGEGIKFFHILSIILEIGSQFIITTIIMLFTMGWEVNNKIIIDTKKLISIIVSGLFIHLLLAGLTNPFNDMYNKFHEFEGIQGFLLISLRLGIFAFSLVSLNKTKQICNRLQNNFLSWFGYIGGLYQLAFPFMIFVGMIFVPYLRYRIVKFGNLFIQIISLILMADLLTEKNEFSRTCKNYSSQLPGFFPAPTAKCPRNSLFGLLIRFFPLSLLGFKND